MIRMFQHQRTSPIGIDLGSRSIKMVQLDADHTSLIDAVRWEIPAQPTPASTPEPNTEGESDSEDECVSPELMAQGWTSVLKKAREGRGFRGREAVICLRESDLFIQNVRLPQVEGSELRKLITQEAAGRIPFAVDQAEIRYLEAADVRQGDSVRREVILLAASRPLLETKLKAVVAAGYKPVGVDAEPLALLRCYAKQFRRDDDLVTRAMFVHVGANRTGVVIAEGAHILFVKYIDVGGSQMDEAVVSSLKIDESDATALRRHNGDRRSDQQDPDVAKSIAEAIRPVVDRLVGELSMCLRYHSVSFRGKPVSRIVLGGGEASTSLSNTIGQRLNLSCEVGNPLRSLQTSGSTGRPGVWDVATGLALKPIT